MPSPSAARAFSRRLGLPTRRLRGWALALPGPGIQSASMESHGANRSACRAMRTMPLYQTFASSHPTLSPVTPGATGEAPAETSAAVGSSESALDVAMRVNRLKRLHQTGGAGENKAQVEQEAWEALNSLQEAQIHAAEGKAVALLLNAWAYFAKFWAHGKDGPAGNDKQP